LRLPLTTSQGAVRSCRRGSSRLTADSESRAALPPT
jgi:hypothetical protein